MKKTDCCFSTNYTEPTVFKTQCWSTLNHTRTNMKWKWGSQNQADYLAEHPALFSDGLPSVMAADTTHPKGDAPSAHSHSPQGPKQPQSPAEHHPQYRAPQRTRNPCPQDLMTGWFQTTAADFTPQQTCDHRKERAELVTMTTQRVGQETNFWTWFLKCEDLLPFFVFFDKIWNSEILVSQNNNINITSVVNWHYRNKTDLTWRCQGSEVLFISLFIYFAILQTKQLRGNSQWINR